MVSQAPATAEIVRAVRAALTDIPAGLILVAVSGGPDSLALAAAAASLQAKAAHRFGAVTVDHDLQAGSAAEAEATRQTCERLGLDPVIVEKVRVGADGGPEAAARTARYAALEQVSEQTGAVAVLLAHTLDDQAETVLLGLSRGSGARSLAGMPSRRGNLHRPLLKVRRDTTAEACREQDLQPWHDPHNVDRLFARVRIRLDALPALEAALGPGVAEALARSAELLRADADFLDELADRELESDTALTTESLAQLAPALRSRVIRRAAIRAGATAGALTAKHVADIERLVTHWKGQGPINLPGGLVAVRSCDRLRFR